MTSARKSARRGRSEFQRARQKLDGWARRVHALGGACTMAGEVIQKAAERFDNVGKMTQSHDVRSGGTARRGESHAARRKGHRPWLSCHVVDRMYRTCKRRRGSDTGT